jgi:hypothetical protein
MADQLVYKKIGNGKYLVKFPDGSVQTINPKGQDIKEFLKQVHKKDYEIQSQDEFQQVNQEKLKPFGGLVVKTDFQHIPAERIDAMVKDGLAIRSKGYVYIADVAPNGGIQTFVLGYNDEDDYKVVDHRTIPGGADNKASLKRYRNANKAEAAVSAYLFKRRANEAQTIAGVVTFTYHMLPFGAAWDAAAKGDWGDVGISLAGDAAFFLTGPLAGAAKTAKGARALRLIGAGIEGTVATTRATQGVFSLMEGDKNKAAGYFGEATLRLLGMSTNAIAGLKKPWKATKAMKGRGPEIVGSVPKPIKATPADLKNPKPNTTYESNGFFYKTDGQGRLSEASGNLRLEKAPRNRRQQKKVASSSGVLGDEGGHMIGTQFGGLGEGCLHLVPQGMKLNRGAGSKWSAMEREWARALKRGDKVTVKIQVDWPKGATRPDGFKATYEITSNKTGIKTVHNENFLNP